MAKIEGDQNIPAELLYLYQGTLTEKQPDDVARKRYPFRIPRMQDSGKGPTEEQRAHRNIFKKCVRCYNGQPYSGGVTPPAVGGRDRSWWFNDAIGSGLWYYDYFMQLTLDSYVAGGVPEWCYELVTGDTMTIESSPNNNYGNYQFVTMGGVAGARAYGYYRKHSVTVNILHLYVLGTGGGPGAWDPYWLYFYVEDTPWGEYALTWNNQPAAGRLFHTIELYGNFRGFIEIPCPDIWSVLIQQRNPKNGYVDIATRNNADVPKRPFWTY